MGKVVDLEGKEIPEKRKKCRKIQKILLETLKENRKGNLSACGLFFIRDDGYVRTKVQISKPVWQSQLTGAVEHLKDHCKE